MRPIHSIEDLRAAKRELAKKRKASKVEFANHLGTLRQDATGFVVKKVALPVGLGIVAAFAVKYFFLNKKDKDIPIGETRQTEVKEDVKENAHKNTWLSYFSILLSIIKIYQSAIAQKQAREAMDEEPDLSDEDNGDSSSEVGMTSEEPDLTEEEFGISPKSFVAQYQQQKAKK